MININYLIPNNTLEATKMASYAAAGLLLGRKVTEASLAAGFKAASQIAGLFGKTELQTQLSAKSDRLLHLAKKNFVGNLTIGASLLFAAYHMNAAEEIKKNRVIPMQYPCSSRKEHLFEDLQYPPADVPAQNETIDLLTSPSNPPINNNQTNITAQKEIDDIKNQEDKIIIIEMLRQPTSQVPLLSFLNELAWTILDYIPKAEANILAGRLMPETSEKFLSFRRVFRFLFNGGLVVYAMLNAKKPVETRLLYGDPQAYARLMKLEMPLQEPQLTMPDQLSYEEALLNLQKQYKRIKD